MQSYSSVICSSVVHAIGDLADSVFDGLAHMDWRFQEQGQCFFISLCCLIRFCLPLFFHFSSFCRQVGIVGLGKHSLHSRPGWRKWSPEVFNDKSVSWIQNIDETLKLFKKKKLIGLHFVDPQAWRVGGLGCGL